VKKNFLIPSKNDYAKNVQQLLEMQKETKAILAQLQSESKNLSSLEYIQKKLFIKTKDARLIPLQLNVPQTKVFNIIQDLKAQNKPVRLIILKARQEGISTLTESLIFEDTARRPYRNSMIVAHDTDGSDHIFGMSQIMYECLPEDERPATRYSNRKELDFAEPLRSKIQVDVAGATGNSAVGRSFTIHNFHASEVAFWADAKSVMMGVLQAVPDNPDTMIVLESTANGVGGYFYDEYWRAKEGKSDFVAVFLPWIDMPEYSRPLEMSETAFIAMLDEEEQSIQNKYNLTLEQLNWRRWAIENKCGGDIDIFKREYPISDVEAFVVSGRPVFNAKKLNTIFNHCKEPKKQGYLIEGGWEENPKGFIKIWEEPEENARYIIGADVAEGLANGDFSSAMVYELNTLEQVAEWHGHIDPDLFGSELIRLGKYYNEAWIGVEVNNHGLATVNKLKMEYTNVYQRKTFDRNTDTWIQKPGWETNVKTKPLMIDDFTAALREDLVVINSKELIQECMTYVKDDKGKCNAQEGCFDDRVVSAMIGFQVYKETPKEEYHIRNYRAESEKTEADKLRSEWQKVFPNVMWAAPEPEGYKVRTLH